MVQDFVYVVETSKSFHEAVIAVRKAAEAHKWGILGDYDFSEILAAKGFPQAEHVKSIDICAPAHANALMGAERLTGLCMPCSVLIFTEKGKTKIAAMRPGVVMPRSSRRLFKKLAICQRRSTRRSKRSSMPPHGNH
jgi:uncharacterized protein (DUF302 family)